MSKKLIFMTFLLIVSVLTFGVTFTFAFAFMAAYCGIRYLGKHQLDDAIKEMLETPGAFLLHVAVKEEANVMPMTPPGATVSEMIFE